MRMWYISLVHSLLSGEKCAVLHDHDAGITFPICYIIISVDTYIVLTCHSSCCDSFHNLLAKRIRQWPNWPRLDISAYFSVCVPVQLQKIKKARQNGIKNWESLYGHGIIVLFCSSYGIHHRRSRGFLQPDDVMIACCHIQGVKIQFSLSI